jgi:hypothetical protein
MAPAGLAQPPDAPGESDAGFEPDAAFEAEPDEPHHDRSPEPGPSTGSGHGGPDGDQ